MIMLLIGFGCGVVVGLSSWLFLAAWLEVRRVADSGEAAFETSEPRFGSE